MGMYGLHIPNSKEIEDDCKKMNRDYLQEQLFIARYEACKYRAALKKVEEARTKQKLFGIRDVIFNNPATIVLWNDGTKTVVKCQKGEEYDPEKGLAMAISKRAIGTNESHSNFNDIFKKWLPKEEPEEKYQKSKGILEQVLGTNVDLIQEFVDAMLDTAEKENE